jgi:ABC-type multidrug transport system fused ATPase/permease subunit
MSKEELRKMKDERSTEILLKEYEIARYNFNQLEGNIWQTAAVFIALSIGGVTVFFTLTEHNWSNFMATTGIALISIFILWYWYGTVNRWLSLEAVLLYRMREIETELNMWSQRYMDYLDTTRMHKQQYELEQKHKERFSKLNDDISNYSTAQVRKRTRLLVWILATGWIVLIGRELLLLLR